MESSTSLISGGEWPSRKDSFSKLGEYFDRPGWWDEGAQALGFFFNENMPPANLLDTRLEVLLQTLEPFTVGERPVTSDEDDKIGCELPKETVDSSSSHDEQQLGVRGTDANKIEQSNQTGPQTQKEVLSPVQPEILGTEHIDEDPGSSLSVSRPPSRNLGHADTETTKSSNDPSLQLEGSIDVAIQRSSELASPYINNNEHLSPSVGAAFNEETLPKPGATIANEDAATSSSLFTGTTTSTRQTSIQSDLSTRASSVVSKTTALLSISFEKDASSAPFEDDDELVTTSDVQDESSNFPQDNESVLRDQSVILASDEHTVQDNPFDEGIDDVESTAAATRTDPTGFQAIKDEFSVQYRIEAGQDSSFLSQDDDVTVVHDPTSAATSFFPPNPYSVGPVEYDYSGFSLNEERATSVAQDASSDHAAQYSSPDHSLRDASPDHVIQDAVPNHIVQDEPLDESTLGSSLHEEPDEENEVEVQDTIETLKVPELLPAVYGLDALWPHIEQSLPISGLSESNYQGNIRADTPPAPPKSPLTPPAEYFGVRVADEQDAVSGAAEEEDDENQKKVVLATPRNFLFKLGDTTSVKATTGGKSWSGKLLESVGAPDVELAQHTAQDQEKDDPETPTTSENIEHKRKQKQSHTNEPPHKKRLSTISEDQDQLAIDTIEAATVTKGVTMKGKSEVLVQKAKDLPITTSYHRDSTDELAQTSPDEPDDPPEPNARSLVNRRGSLVLAKSKPNKSTPSRSRARETAPTTKTSTAIGKPAAAPKTSKGGVGSKEFAGLFESSPPRKAAEKAKADLGSRLRSQSNTPAPAIPKKAVFVTAKQIPDTGTPSTTTQLKRERPPGFDPLGNPEPADLGTVLETKPRTRISTIAPATPKTTSAPSTKSAPKQRVKNAIPEHDLDNLGTVMTSRTRSRNPSIEPVVEETIRSDPPVKRVRKPAAKSATKAAAKPAAKTNPFALTSKSQGTPAASRKTAPAKKQTAESAREEEETPLVKLGVTKGKRKRQDEDEHGDKDARDGDTRHSRRIAGKRGQEE